MHQPAELVSAAIGYAWRRIAEPCRPRPFVVPRRHRRSALRMPAASATSILHGKNHQILTVGLPPIRLAERSHADAQSGKS
jgi:hypothetical protein